MDNLVKDNDSSRETFSETKSADSAKSRSTPLVQEDHDNSCPFRQFLRRKHRGDASVQGKRDSDDRVPLATQPSFASAAQVTPANGFGIERSLPSDELNVRSVTSLSIEPSRSELIFQEIDGGVGPSGRTDYSSESILPKPSMAKMSSSRKNSFRSIRSYMHFIRPLNSLESCLSSQLYKKYREMEEYMISLHALASSSTIRPFFPTNEKRIVSREGDFPSKQLIETDISKQPQETFVKQKENFLGIPPLPRVVSMELARDINLKTGRPQDVTLCTSNEMLSGKYFHSQGDKKLLLCLGILIGMIPSVIVHKREVENLRELLKQTENLVQDLQEEIEMKDAITVKELVDENNDSQHPCGHTFHDMETNAPTIVAEDLTKLANHDGEPLHGRRVCNSEHMMTIEAELEAELERLELSMDTSSVREGLPNFVEHDPEFVADVVRGELRADMVPEGVGAQTDSGSTSTSCSAYYAVSPRELSLRLHEVIQSRLEERVKELEAALEISEKKVRDLESKQMYSWRELSDSESEFSSNREDQIVAKGYSPNSQPLGSGLSQVSIDALNGYIEERATSGAHEIEPLEEMHMLDESFCTPMLHCIINREISNVDISSDENDNSDEEMEKLLIKQIVERTKQGSPALLNAQRALFSMVENKQQNY